LLNAIVLQSDMQEGCCIQIEDSIRDVPRPHQKLHKCVIIEMI
jgi:hypothetical protein